MRSQNVPNRILKAAHKAPYGGHTLTTCHCLITVKKFFWSLYSQYYIPTFEMMAPSCCQWLRPPVLKAKF